MGEAVGKRPGLVISLPAYDYGERSKRTLFYSPLSQTLFVPCRLTGAKQCQELRASTCAVARYSLSWILGNIVNGENEGGIPLLYLPFFRIICLPGDDPLREEATMAFTLSPVMIARKNTVAV